MNKKRLYFVGGLLLIGLMFSGCQNKGDLQNKYKDKQSNTKTETSKKGDLTALGGDAKALTEKLSEATKDNHSQQGIEDDGSQNNINNNESGQLNNSKKNTMDNQSQNKENLPIDMKLAKTCKKATLFTNFGSIEIEFFNKQAPITVANFCTLVKKGFYNNLTFHRVIKGFMIQGGDPNGDGTGGPGYKFKDELSSNNHNNKYTIAMANAGPNTNGSQFFINTENNNFLDGKHTVFGRVVKGQKVVDKIESVQTDSRDKPIEDVVIRDVKLVESGNGNQ